MRLLNEKRNWCLYIAAFAWSLAGLLIVLACLHVEPFGNITLLKWDMDIQYVDLFTYYRRVLLGETSLTYSFSKSLGGSAVAVWGYYLASPLNLLVVFFKPEQMTWFVLFVTCAKIGLCGGCMAVFLRQRFSEMHGFWVVMLSVCYALSYYNVTQMSNVMWLDGVYLLPLIALGIHQYVSDDRKALFCVSVMMSILFNWYTAYMNGLFAILYFLFEYFSNKKRTRDSLWREMAGTVKDIVCFGVYGILSVLATMVLFFPIMKGLLGGKGVQSNSFVFDLSANGSVLDVLKGFVLGTPFSGTSRDLVLFCGTVCLGGMILFFWNKRIAWKTKLMGGIVLLILWLSLFLRSLEYIWNGFREAYSYGFRSSYIAIFFLLVLCGAELGSENREDLRKKARIFLPAAGILFLVLYEWQKFERKRLIFVLVVLAVLFGMTFVKWNKTVARGILGGVMIAELCVNGYLVNAGSYNMTDDDYASYSKEQQQVVDIVKGEDDTGFYRMEQTAARGSSATSLEHNYLESMTYGYYNLSHYSSAYDTAVSKLIARLGYSDMDEIVKYDEPILSSDSLLGVKYLLSDYAYPGWTASDDTRQYNGKQIYTNSYALSLGMVLPEAVTTEEIEQTNPFLYQNALFSELAGENVEIYKPLAYTVEESENGVSYRLAETASGEDIVYGYGRYAATDLGLYVDGTYRAAYQTWLSYLVYNIGYADSGHDVFMENLVPSDYDEVSFYYLDMDVFLEVMARLQSNAAQVELPDESHVTFTVSAQEGDVLFTTVPYDEGWTIVRNGETVSGSAAAGALTQIPLEAGENVIQMEYHIPGLKEGACMSVAAVGILGILGVRKRRKKRNEK